MKTILFPVLNGNVAGIQHQLGDSLHRLSEGSLSPRYLWITTMFQKVDDIGDGEYLLRWCVEEDCPSDSQVSASSLSMRYEGVSLMDAIRVNRIETPWVPLEDLLHQAIIYLHVSKRFLKNNGIDGVVFLMGRGLFQRCLGLMARQLGIPTWYLCDAFIPGNTTHIFDSETNATDDLRWIPLTKLNKEEQGQVYVFKKRQKEIKVITSSPYDTGSLRRKMHSFFVLLTSDDTIYGNRSAVSQFCYELLRKMRASLSKRFYSSEFPEKYVLLPYQVYYDLLLPLLYPELTDIVYLTEVVSSSLPDGYTLVVKEHPHFKGGTELGELRRISHMRNVIVAPVDADINGLLEKSSGVITICSSVGWQAMIYDKPVMVLNNTVSDSFRFYYADYGLTFNSDVDSLKDVMAKALNTEMPKGFYDPFLYHVILDRCKGTPRLCPVDYNSITEDGNMNVVSEYLFRKMQERFS